MRALIGLLLLAIPGAYAAGKMSGGVMIALVECDPSPPIKGRKTFRV